MAGIVIYFLLPSEKEDKELLCDLFFGGKIGERNSSVTANKNIMAASL